MTRVGIYARVSTKDKGQDTENQMLQLRRYAKVREWQAIEFIDHETGKHSDRDAFKALFEAAQRRQIDIVLVWSLDRLTREGVWETFDHIRRLTSYGVQFESLTEAHFRTTGPAGELMIAIAAWIAKQERLRISERTKAGMERAKAAGKHCGRPRLIFNRERARKLRAAGKSWNQVAAALKIKKETLRTALYPRVKRSVSGD